MYKSLYTLKRNIFFSLVQHIFELGMISFLCMHEILADISLCICIYTCAINKGKLKGKHCKILPEDLS